MLIDWFTVIAQIINFLILLFLLHRFLYKPILKTIDKRQDQMQARWDAAEAEQEKARVEAEKHRQAQRELDDQREQILADARAEAEETRHAELQQVREDLAQKRQEWHDALENEQQSVMADLREQFGQQVMDMVRKVLQDLANADLEQQTVKAFQKQLQDLDDETRQSIAEAFAHQDQPVTVQTGMELPQDSQDDLRQSLQDANLLNGQAVNFDVSPDLLFGIRLHNQAYDLAWDAQDYLQELERAIKQELPTTSVSSQKPRGDGQNASSE
jgi:F-type H+-transporting ATPase subunit b